jgi:hypothetical protein
MREIYSETPYYVVYKENGKLVGFEKEAKVKKDDAFTDPLMINAKGEEIIFSNHRR